MASGTLTPAAINVSPIIVSGTWKVKPIKRNILIQTNGKMGTKHYKIHLIRKIRLKSIPVLILNLLTRLVISTCIRFFLFAHHKLRKA